MLGEKSLTATDLASVVASVKKLRVNHQRREFDLQGAIAAQLAADGIPHAREVKLGPGNVIDFLVPGGIGIEVKKGKPPSTARVLAQVERYAAFPAITSIVVVVEGKLHNVAGSTENGKPCVCVNLAKQWGVAV